jgi:uncharacterized repeat protein (TIGR01451 family)
LRQWRQIAGRQTLIWGAKLFDLRLIAYLLIFVAAVSQANAEILTPPTVNGTYPTGGSAVGTGSCTSPNQAGTTGINTGTLSGLGALGPNSFSLTASIVRGASSTTVWNDGVCFPTANTIRFQPTLAPTTANGANGPGYGAYDFNFTPGVNALSFKINGIDNGDYVELFAYSGGTPVPILASYVAPDAGLTAYTPLVNRFSGTATDSNARGYSVANPSGALSLIVTFPSNVSVTRVLSRYGKTGNLTGNATSIFSDFKWNVDTTITLKKKSVGGVSGFVFNGTNGFGAAETITTTTQGTFVTGATHILTNANTATTVTETIPIGYALTGVVCTGMGTGTATPNLATGAVALNAAALAPGNNVVCEFANALSTPSHSITKTQSSGPNPITAAGQTLGYTISIANVGNTSLTTVLLTDALTQGSTNLTLTSGPTRTSGDIDSDNVLDVGETWQYSASYSVPQSAIDTGTTLSNIATVDTDQTSPLASATVTTPITQNRTLSISKSAKLNGNPVGLPISTTLSAGDIINYSYLVSNSGNVSISGISIVETAFTGTSTAPTPTGGATSLAPGASTTFTATYTVTQTDIDTLQ